MSLDVHQCEMFYTVILDKKVERLVWKGLSRCERVKMCACICVFIFASGHLYIFSSLTWNFIAIMQHLDITFRRDPTNFRPRINKLDSTKDREQKSAGSYYYLDD